MGDTMKQDSSIMMVKKLKTGKIYDSAINLADIP